MHKLANTMVFVLVVSVIEFVAVKLPFVVLLFSLKSAVIDIPTPENFKLKAKEESEVDKKPWNLDRVGADDRSGLLEEDDILVEPLEVVPLVEVSPIVVASSRSSRSTTRVLSSSNSCVEGLGDELLESPDKEGLQKKEK